MAKRPFTLSGWRVLMKEHDQLLRDERPRVLQRISDAAAEGDRSENAEYIYGRKRLRELDKRIAYLAGLLGDVDIVDPTTLSGDKVCFGATVVVEEDGGARKKWQIVGEGESSISAGAGASEGHASISFQSPMARALLGKRVGDVVIVERPAGELEVEVVELWFADRRIG